MAYISCDFKSEVLDMDTVLRVILPESGVNEDTKVLYLLHGIKGNSSAWQRFSRIESYIRDYNIAVIIPEVQRSFYINMEYGLKYFDYITKELPQDVKKFFNLNIKRENSYVMGLSMGGYGALKCAFTYPENYIGCASFSGAVDLKFLLEYMITNDDSIKNEAKGVIGDSLKPENDLFWLLENHTVEEIPNMYISCGDKDFLKMPNYKMREYLNSKNYKFLYEEWEGEHTWDFWDVSVVKALKYFDLIK